MESVTPEPKFSPSPRVINLVLVFAATSFTVAVTIAIYLALQYAAIQKLKAKLLVENEVQAKLLQANPGMTCLVPHASGEIGWVLSPAMGECALWAKAGEKYAINSLGLRGAEIPEKRNQRILLVGDSWVFGWELSQPDTLASQLERFLNERQSAKRYEVITVAIPGWNTESEAKFLEGHRHILKPDFIIWNVSQNDVEDLSGVIPPGFLASYLSPQSPVEAPFTYMAHSFDWPSPPTLFWHTTSPMPFIVERWKKNFELIQQFSRSAAVPTLILSVGLSPEYLAILSGAFEISVPVIMDAPKFLMDSRWPVTRGDLHPSAWANGILAPTLAAKMQEMGFVSPLQLSEQEKTDGAEWKVWSKQAITREMIDDYVRRYTQKLPTSFDAQRHKAMGIHRGDGAMADRGVLFLRVEPGHRVLEFKIALDDAQRSLNQQLRVTVQSYGGTPFSSTKQMDEAEVTWRLPIPSDGTPRHPLFEIRWQFDTSLFASPTLRDNATLLGVTPRS
jgi:hypothetical protein